ncbi:hypothetical protein [Vibrio vulnificus]|uniref:hypothetical protein n=1 Tax=Vibrio vulnificus TaxID=672 RepID=UPI001FAF2416|nr:hypothetical protein [Vibrio vulnificus]MCJ0804034.1 hypothetical protein [Vibrio vulnificus]
MNKVTVKALKPFYWGQFSTIMKTSSSDPFEVTEYEYKQLAANGMVKLVEDSAEEETKPQEGPDLQAEPAPIDPEPEPKKPKTTRSKTRK